jgi:hypothetical protein
VRARRPVLGGAIQKGTVFVHLEETVNDPVQSRKDAVVEWLADALEIGRPAGAPAPLGPAAP